jgi:hypothetical protein
MISDSSKPSTQNKSNQIIKNINKLLKNPDLMKADYQKMFGDKGNLTDE